MLNKYKKHTKVQEVLYDPIMLLNILYTPLYCKCIDEFWRGKLEL